MITLDRYCEDNGIRRIDVLKIDAEGGEPAVLSGAQGLLGRGRIGTVLCELNDFHLERMSSSRRDVEVLLGRHGFARVDRAGKATTTRHGPIVSAGKRRRLRASQLTQDRAPSRMMPDVTCRLVAGNRVRAGADACE